MLCQQAESWCHKCGGGGRNLKLEFTDNQQQYTTVILCSLAARRRFLFILHIRDLTGLPPHAPCTQKHGILSLFLCHSQPGAPDVSQLNCSSRRQGSNSRAITSCPGTFHGNLHQGFKSWDGQKKASYQDWDSWTLSELLMDYACLIAVFHSTAFDYLQTAFPKWRQNTFSIEFLTQLWKHHRF